MENDPYLKYQPAFAYTLPIQLLVSGITFTLLVMLLIHLLFTTQYHYPLAPLNYCLQLSSIITVLISVSIRIGVILHDSANRADRWPYALDYIAVSVPVPTWTTGEDAAWFLLEAISNGLANLTHIQFLTLLYPSRLEARLILILLGPLAIASSALFFCTLSPHRTVIDLGDAIRNVFSSTLLLIFGLSLAIWGLLVNRRRAWRLDGGTAVFGMGALILAVVTTASSFVAVKEEGLNWLQPLIWAAVLWQTWLGWWWWVGAGMGIGEVEDIMERALHKRRKAARRAHRRDVINATGNGQGNGSAGPNAPRRQTSVGGQVGAAMRTGASSAMAGFQSGLAHIVHSSSDGSGIRRRDRRRERAPDIEEGLEGEEIELGALRLREPVRETGTENGSGSGGGNGQVPSSNSETSSTSRTPSLHPPRSLGEVLSFPSTWLQVYFRRLRRAHEEAARRRAVEQAERRSRIPNITGNGEDGWGLGAFGIREAQESTWRVQEANRQMREDALLGDGDGDGDGDNGGDMPDVHDSDDEHPDVHDSDRDRAREERRASSQRRTSRDTRDTRRASRDTRDTRREPREGDRRTSSVRESRREGESRIGSVSRSRRGSMARGNPDDVPDASTLAVPTGVPEVEREHEHDSDWEDVDSDPDGDRHRRRRHRRSHPPSRSRSRDRDRSRDPTPPPDPPPGQARTNPGWSWWGPLREWRLQDRSTF